MTMERGAVEPGRVQLVAEEDADERHGEAHQRRRVLEEDGEQARVLAVVDRGDGAAPAPRPRPAERAPGDAEREALEDRGESEDDVVDGRVLERRRVLDVR